MPDVRVPITKLAGPSLFVSQIYSPKCYFVDIPWSLIEGKKGMVMDGDGRFTDFHCAIAGAYKAMVPVPAVWWSTLTS